MGFTNYYVDPLNGSDTTGDGLSDATAWQTVQHALDSIARDTTDGDQINIKAGTADVLTATLDFSTYGTPAASAGVVFRGYTSAANDGGIGEIDGNGFNISTQNSCGWVDLKLHNGDTSGWMVKLNSSTMHNCEVYDVYNGVNASSYSVVSNCHIHNCDNYGIHCTANGLVVDCYVRSRAADSRGAMNRCIYNVHRPGSVSGCIVSLDSNTVGIDCGNDGAQAYNNSVFATAGTGEGIRRTHSVINNGCWNNIIEGFSGTGGAGISFNNASPNEMASLIANNTIYNCTTAIENDNDLAQYKADNDTPAASPFKKSGSDTYANRFTYFEPDTNYAGTNVSGNGSRGAVAAAAGGGGSNVIVIEE